MSTDSSLQTQSYRITGMDCADCARTIERGVAGLAGVSSCTLNYGAALLKVAGAAPREQVVARIQALGYGVRESGAAWKQADTPPSGALAILLSRLPRHGAAGFLRFLLSRLNTTLAVVGLILVLPSLVFHELLPFLGVSGPWLDVTAIAAMVVAGIPIARGAWRSLTISREISINLLMTIAAIGAIVIS